MNVFIKNPSMTQLPYNYTAMKTCYLIFFFFVLDLSKIIARPFKSWWYRARRILCLMYLIMTCKIHDVIMITYY